ncbi:spore coat protein [Paenibacillus roseipurpureus]|uniref:Spore coat protein n=1 Tax=Paenibacillus roseopurpureus TaxID=2918901 RepID=A0AA96LRJ0_9BACL|nr:spore coat protein [Paenibacillus sp. MBLB1832]WNR44739.1 spore coat protein [Paenibacillus sp. MBLB1832]
MYQQHSQSNENATQVHLQDLDYANFVLSELKRSAREYTTAALEAANPGIRQTFETLLQHTLDDQMLIFQEIQKLGGYATQPAQPMMIQQELQKMSQTSLQVQSLVQEHEGSTATASYVQQERGIQGSAQQNMQQQPPSYPTYTQPMNQQSHSQTEQNEVAAIHQAPTAFQPVNYANQFPNAVYNSNQRSQGIGVNAIQHASQPVSYSTPPTQGRGYQDQSHAPSNFGQASQERGYAASSPQQGASMGGPGPGLGSGRPQARIISRNQPGQPYTTDEGSSRHRPQHGGKYSF